MIKVGENYIFDDIYVISSTRISRSIFVSYFDFGHLNTVRIWKKQVSKVGQNFWKFEWKQKLKSTRKKLILKIRCPKLDRIFGNSNWGKITEKMVLKIGIQSWTEVLEIQAETKLKLQKKSFLKINA